jgi:hypothetical protein
LADALGFDNIIENRDFLFQVALDICGLADGDIYDRVLFRFLDKHLLFAETDFSGQHQDLLFDLV